ncbi:hypothetical protein BXT84_12680 [Sulfobacillus thermotolerans]|uniref:Uncharacterized protein n=1 Tax=Sulfobacillus thermotolerans TaxID=338644 RepID=A0ABN5H274_9FIRM|nr:hypothetical protein BXT84_12680 [Sulfobacillus thermotolerans]
MFTRHDGIISAAIFLSSIVLTGCGTTAHPVASALPLHSHTVKTSPMTHPSPSTPSQTLTQSAISPPSSTPSSISKGQRVGDGLASTAGPSSSDRSHMERWVYITYTNKGPAGSFTLRVPQQFAAQPAPTDHDGRIWVDGLATITAYSEINAFHATLSTYQLVNSENTNITYRAHGLNWRVASGVQGDMIVYSKVFWCAPDIFQLTLRYPQSDQRAFQPMVTEVANSFHPKGCLVHE